MIMNQQSPEARHSKAYREKKKAKAQALGTNKSRSRPRPSVEQRLLTIMARRCFSGLVELFQAMALNVLDAAPDLAAQMLKHPIASELQIKPKYARQLRELAKIREPDGGHE